MANQDHLDILKQGVETWNAWREANPHVRPDLQVAHLEGADLDRANLAEANLLGANLKGARLFRANLFQAHLEHADLFQAHIEGADLSRVALEGAHLEDTKLVGTDFGWVHAERAHLEGADLTGADLEGTNFRGANLRGVRLNRAYLSLVNLSGAQLNEVDFTNATLGYTCFGDVDLTTVRGLETVEYVGPSTIGIDTIIRSRGKIPESFLLGCGVPQSFIDYIPSLIGSMEPIQYDSCFISYSTKDEPFARRLHERMRAEHLRVWYPPEEIQGGKKIIDQLDRAIQLHDRLLLVLSEHSMQSAWVLTEVLKAREAERKEGRQKLFPIRLVDFDTIKSWRYVDPDSGKDIGREIREYHIPDFSNWKDHDAFEAAFARLLRDLRSAERPER